MAVLGLKLTQDKVIRLWTCNIPTASHHCTSNQSVSVCRDTVLQAVSLIKGARFWVTSSCFPIFFITYPPGELWWKPIWWPQWENSSYTLPNHQIKMFLFRGTKLFNSCSPCGGLNETLSESFMYLSTGPQLVTLFERLRCGLVGESISLEVAFEKSKTCVVSNVPPAFCACGSREAPRFPSCHHTCCFLSSLCSTIIERTL